MRRGYFCGSPDHIISNCMDKKSKEGKNKPGKSRVEDSPISYTTAILLSPTKTDIESYKVRVPLMPVVKTEDVQELDNGLKVVKGYVNGVKAWVLRDTTVCISKTFAEKLDMDAKAERFIRPFGGHLGNKKTRDRILNHFYWRGIFPDVSKFCRTCGKCQTCIPKGRVPKAPLIPIQPMGIHSSI